MKGRTVLITGSTAGIGLTAARGFAAEGCNVVLNGIEDQDVGDKLAQAIENDFGTQAIFHGADVGDHLAVEALYAAAIARFGSVDIVVNNAVVRFFGPVEDCDPADWDRAIAVNLTSAFHTIRLSLPAMRKNGWGRIINVSSVFGTLATRDRASYITTKTALLGLTRAIAMETLDDSITCNSVCPGAVNTSRSSGMIDAMVKDDGLSVEDAEAKFLVGRQPNGRFVDSKSVAAMMVFLCGPASDSITGASFPIDGGWTTTSVVGQ